MATRILLIEDNSTDALLIQQLLEVGGGEFELNHVETLGAAIERLRKKGIDLILLDLSLPDSHGFESFSKIGEYAERLPIIVLSGIDDEELAVKTVESGAQDYLVKGSFDPHLLVRSFQYAIKRKQTELALFKERALMRALLDNSPDRIYFKDRKSRFIRVNRALSDLFHLSDPKKARGKTDFDFFSTEHAEAAYRDEQRIIESGEPLIGAEEKETHSDGRVTWAFTTKMPLRDNQGNIVGTFGISREITEKRRAEEALKKAYEEMEQRVQERTSELQSAYEELEHRADKLKQINAELQNFAYVASHDLQEPLRMVTSYLQLIERRLKGRLDGDTQEFIQFAVDGASRMKALIHDLLAYSRVGTRTKAFQPTDLGEVLQRVLRHLEMRIESTDAIVESGNLPTVNADDTQLLQLLQNLIGNALKFCRDRKPVVRLNAEEQPDAWLITLQDNGIGIDAKFAERVFSIFQRLHTRDDYEGTGIGLAICRKVVEQHGGKIWFESVPGEGTTFYFTIAK